MNASPTKAVLPPLEWHEPEEVIERSRIVRAERGVPPPLRGVDVYEYPDSVGRQAWAAAQRQEAACVV